MYFSDGPTTNYTTAPAGLYPAVLSSQSAKQRDARLKKFEFIGRLLAQALIDSRMVNILICSLGRYGITY